MTKSEGTATMSATTAFISRAYDETVALIEEMSDYLLNHARRDRESLPPAIQALYASESIRLTTRLTQLMAWLLNHKAVQTGEISLEDAGRLDRRLGSVETCLKPPGAGVEQLPEAFKSLMDRSEELYRRVLRLDRRGPPVAGESPVHGLIRTLSDDLTSPPPPEQESS